MIQELQQNLVNKYPIIFKDYGGDPRETCMAWGICCGDGWYKILDEMCKEITDLLEGTKWYFVAEQVKEKFGGLRFYYKFEPYKNNFLYNLETYILTISTKLKFSNPYWFSRLREKIFPTKFEKVVKLIEDLVDNTENLSYKTCEVCGKPGKPLGGGWVRTLCEEHSEGKPETNIKTTKYECGGITVHTHEEKDE